MKKIVFIGLIMFIALCWVPTQPVYAVEKEIKEVVEEFIKVKMIEERIVLGYPIEDVALMDNLKLGRDIEYVVEYFEKYYEEDVLKQYLYYLKRSTSQKLYLSVGVFWGSEFRVAGNVFKREANELKYDIEYKSIEEESDITKVIVEVTPTYVGEYNVRGKEISEFIDEKKTLELYLREDKNGDYKLTQLNNELIKKMEVEIGEEIELNQPKDSPVYPKLEEFIYESEEQREGMYFTYDIFTRLSAGGLDKLYDRYDKLWVEDKKWLTLAIEKISLENLKNNYRGWDYAYFEKNGDTNFNVLAFDVKGEEVTKISLFTVDEGSVEDIKEANRIVTQFDNLLNNELNLLLGSSASKTITTENFKEYLYENYSSKEWENLYLSGEDEFLYPTITYLLLTQLSDAMRFSSSAKVLEWQVNPITKQYNMTFPPGNAEMDVYQKNNVIYNLYGPYFNWNKEIDPVVGKRYFFEEINYYRYSEEVLFLENNNSNWKIIPFGSCLRSNLDGKEIEITMRMNPDKYCEDLEFKRNEEILKSNEKKVE